MGSDLARLGAKAVQIWFRLGSDWVQIGVRLGSDWVQIGFRLGSDWVQIGFRLGSGLARLGAKAVQIGFRFGSGLARLGAEASQIGFRRAPSRWPRCLLVKSQLIWARGSSGHAPRRAHRPREPLSLYVAVLIRTAGYAWPWLAPDPGVDLSDFVAVHAEDTPQDGFFPGCSSTAAAAAAATGATTGATPTSVRLHQ